jgi:hypothetical protein
VKVFVDCAGQDVAVKSSKNNDPIIPTIKLFITLPPLEMPDRMVSVSQKCYRAAAPSVTNVLETYHNTLAVCNSIVLSYCYCASNMVFVWRMSASQNGTHTKPMYERVALSKLRQGRLGKHHHFVENVCKQLQALPEGEALKIPLNSADGLSKTLLRSAIVRAASSRKLRVSTYSDSHHFYVWRRTKSTAPYERARKQPRRVRRRKSAA